MAGEDPRTDRIRALIEEVDHVRRESERMTSHAERSMKRAYWPDRRRSLRMPRLSGTSDHNDEDAA